MQSIKKVHKGDRVIEFEGIRLRFMSERYYCEYGQYGRRNAKTIEGKDFANWLEDLIKKQNSIKM